MKKIFTIIISAVSILAITATVFAANFINAEQARNIAEQWVPSNCTYLLTKEENDNYRPSYEVKFYDNSTMTEYEIEILKNGGIVKEFKMESKRGLGSTNIVLSTIEIQDLVRKEYPVATFTNVKLDRDDGLYEYEVDFYTPELRGEMKFNPENGALLKKELKYKV